MIQNNADFIEERKHVLSLYRDISYIYEGTVESTTALYAEVAEPDYLAPLAQFTEILSEFNKTQANLNFLLRTALVLGFYAYVFELACKPLSLLARYLLDKEGLSCGKYRELLVQKYPKRYGSIAEYFDNFLRNAIQHAQYIIMENGDIETWNMIKGRRSQKKTYRSDTIFNMTEKLMFFILNVFTILNQQIEDYLVDLYALRI